MEYHVQDSNENAILHSYMTMIDKYIGDKNICIHIFMTQVVDILRVRMTTFQDLFCKTDSSNLSFVPLSFEAQI